MHPLKQQQISYAFSFACLLTRPVWEYFPSKVADVGTCLWKGVQGLFFRIFHFKVLTSGSLTFFMHTLQEEGVMSVLGKISRLKLQLKKYIKGALRNFSVVLESQSFPKPTKVSYRRSQLVEWVESLRHRSVCIQSHPFHCHWKTNPKLSTVQECWTT